MDGMERSNNDMDGSRSGSIDAKLDQDTQNTGETKKHGVTSQAWSNEDVQQLYHMIANNKSISHVCRKLKRTKEAVLNAQTKMITQQLIFHPIDDVMRFYEVDQDGLHNTLTHPKFYVPLRLADKSQPGGSVLGIIVASIGVSFFVTTLIHSADLLSKLFRV